MNHRHSQNYIGQKSVSALLSTLVLSVLLPATFSAPSLANSSLQAQAAPTRTVPDLRELLDSVIIRPNKPFSSEPAVAEPTSEPAPAEAVVEEVKLLLKLSERRVYVYRGDSVEKSYPVAVGRPGWETPTGEFEVFHQLTDPGWTNPLTGDVMTPGPDNPLGDRWIAFWTDGNNSIGFHGTPNRKSVGTAASHGCIRMYNEDVRELYEIVSVGTPVVVEL